MIGIFGGSGFVGRNLTRYLEGNYLVKQISLRKKGDLSEVSSCSIIINLIGKAHDHKNQASREDFYESNYNVVKAIYKAFVESEATLFIHISSIAAIEEVESDRSLTEDMNSNPISWYGKSKLEAERFLLAQNLPSDKKIIILRPTMIHGPGDKGNLKLLFKIVTKRLPYPLGEFSNKRNFLSIQNFNFCISQIIDKERSIKGGIYHICDDRALSTLDIIQLIGKVTKKRILYIRLPRNFVFFVAKIGDIIPLPLNSVRLKKMTSNLEVSNQKFLKEVGLEKMPLSSLEGLETTIRSFSN